MTWRAGVAAVFLSLVSEALVAEQFRRAKPHSSDSIGVSPSPHQGSATPSGSNSLSIDGDFDLGGFVFKEGYVLLHDTGGPEALNTALGFGALADVTPGLPDSRLGIGNTAHGAIALRQNTTGSFNTASGTSALASTTTGSRNTATGAYALLFNRTGYGNTASGAFALYGNTTGALNAGSGTFALYRNTEGVWNTAAGASALFYNTTGARNTASGAYALYTNTTGSLNIAVGYAAGAYSRTGSNNIFVGNRGAAGDSGVIRIGASEHTSTFIDGIFGATSFGGSQVVVNSNNQLSTLRSASRFKESIEDMGEASARLEELRPVTFRYTERAVGDGPRPVEFGLIAEEVADVFPHLVIYDEDGEAYSVRYHVLTPMLLNELQKQHARIGVLTWLVGVMLVSGVTVTVSRWRPE